MLPVIAVAGLGKRYGRTVAVDDVSLEVYEGEIFVFSPRSTSAGYALNR